MKIKVNIDRSIFINAKKLGQINENNFEILEFTFPEELEDYTKYIEIETDDGKFVDEIEENTYTITRAMSQYSIVKMQVVCKDLANDIVFKSNTFTLPFDSSINASEEIPEKEKDLLDKIELELQEVNESIENVQETLAEQEQRIEDLQSDKVDKEQDKGLSTNDYTNEEKAKLARLENYDDTKVKEDITNLQGQVTNNEQNISTINAEQITQNTDIQNNSEEIEEIKSIIAKKRNLITNYTEIADAQLNNVGWYETATGYSTNRKGIPVEGGKIYSFCVNGFPAQMRFVSFKTADDLPYSVQNTFIKRVLASVYVIAPANAKYMFFTSSSSDFKNVTCYEGYSADNIISDSIWTKDKVLMTLGDSLSEAGIWQTAIAGKLGFSKIKNLAVGGTKVNVFADNVTAENIEDVDVITIMGFFNSTSSVAGTITDEASHEPNASICANYKYIIDKLFTLKPTVKIILITPHCPKAQNGSEKANAVKQIANYYHLPCIDLYNKAGFNTYTFDNYLKDAVHSSYGPDGGYAQEANAIYSQILAWSGADVSTIEKIRVDGEVLTPDTNKEVDIVGKENISNKVTSISSASTDTEYPSAKCVYDSQAEQDAEVQALQDKVDLLESLIPTDTATGESLTLSNTARYPFKEFNVSGNTVQKQYNGKNLAQPNTHTENGITLTYDEDGVYHLKGTATSTFTFKIINRVTLSGTYTFAILDRSNTNISVWFWNNTTSSTDPLLNSEHLSITKTYSSENEIANGNISITSGVTYDYSFKVQIEQGSTVTSYEPYVGGQASPNPSYPQEIENVLGEVEVKVENKNYAINETIGGNTPVMSNISGNYAGAVTVAVKPITGTQQVNYRITYKDGTKYDQSIVPINANNNVWYKINYTTTKVIAGIGLYFISSTGTKRTAEHIMILKGTYSNITDADYAAHEEQLATLHLPEGMEMYKKDEFVWQNEKWYKNKKIKKRVLNGTEAWAVVNMAYTKGYYLTDNDIKANSKSTTLADALCSHAIQVSPDANWSSAASSSNFAILNGSKMIRFAMGEKVSNLEEFKSWLGENNVTIECELATPVLEEITDATLISDLNNLKNLYSYKGATHISSDSDPSLIFEAVYRKELESIANS